MTEVFAPQSSTDSRKVVRSFGEDGTASFSAVRFEELDFTGLFGPAVSSTTENTISGGVKVFTLDYDEGTIKLDYTIQMLSADDPSCWMYGVVTKVDTIYEPLQITVAVFKTSALAITSSNWAIQVVAGPFQGIPASQALGISTNSMALPAMGDSISITTDPGKAYIAGSVVYMAAIEDSTSWNIIAVASYDAITGALTGFVRQSGGTGLTYAIWTVAMIDTSGDDVSMIATSSTNLTIGSGTKVFTVQAGKFFPDDGQVFVTALASPTNHMVGGVVSYVGTTLTLFIPAPGVFGSGTFSSWSILLLQGPTVPPSRTVNGHALTSNVVISAADLTAGTLPASAFPALTGDVTTSAGSLATTLAAGSASNLNSGTLPAGRLPALTGDVTSSAGSAATTLATGNAGNLNSGTLLAARMPAHTGVVITSAGAVATTFNSTLVPKVVYSGVISVASTTRTVSSYDAATDIITASGTHGLITGESVQFTGTVPAGTVASQPYYCNALSTTTFALYNTYANSIADTSRINLTGATTGATIRHVISTPANLFNNGLQASGGVAGVTGTTTLGLEFNLATALTSTNAVVQLFVGQSLVDSGGTARNIWLLLVPCTIASTTQITTATPGFWAPIAALNNGTWAQQSATAFTLHLVIYG